MRGEKSPPPRRHRRRFILPATIAFLARPSRISLSQELAAAAARELHDERIPQAWGGGQLNAEQAEARSAPGGRHQGQGQGQQAPRPSAAPDRLSVMKMALGEFVEHAVAFELPAAAGLFLFGSEVEEECGLTPAFQLFKRQVELAAAEAEADSRGGVTRLYEAIRRAAAALESFGAAYPSCEALRILALTDGEDTTGEDCAEALALLQRGGITLDCVLLGGKAGTLAAMSLATGGTALQPHSMAQVRGLIPLAAA